MGQPKRRRIEDTICHKLHAFSMVISAEQACCKHPEPSLKIERLKHIAGGWSNNTIWCDSWPDLVESIPSWRICTVMSNAIVGQTSKKSSGECAELYQVGLWPQFYGSCSRSFFPIGRILTSLDDSSKPNRTSRTLEWLVEIHSCYKKTPLKSLWSYMNIYNRHSGVDKAWGSNN